MRTIFLLGLLTVFTKSIGQKVGVNTTSPQETLDVNGTTKFRTTNQTNVTTTKIGGLDANGVFREITVGSNLNLNNNVLSSTNGSKYTFGEITINDNSNSEQNNVDLLIGTGGINAGKNIIRVKVLDNSGNLKLTGIKAGTDGQHVWLYPQNGKLKLKTNDEDSLAPNRIESNDKPGAAIYEMIEIIYDATRSKWIVMQNHS